MAAIDPKNLTKASFPEAIKTCKKYESKFKDKEVKKKKYEGMRKVFEESEETLNKAIEATKSITMASGKSFYDEFVDGKEATVSLAWLGDKLATESARITGGDIPDLGAHVSVEFKYDFVDRMKQLGIDFTKGKGLAKGITTAASGVLIGELLTQGVTSFLAKKGIIDGAMGLLGLGKLGIEYAPMAWQAIAGAATSIASWSMLVPIAAGVLVAVKTVPVIKNIVDKVKAKHKEAGAFDENMQKILTEQKVMG